MARRLKRKTVHCPICCSYVDKDQTAPDAGLNGGLSCKDTWACAVRGQAVLASYRKN